VQNFIEQTYKTIQTRKWDVSILGGKEIPVEPAVPGGKPKLKTVPEHVALMAVSCAMYDYSPRHRLYRTLLELCYFANQAKSKGGFRRSINTQQFYDGVLDDLKRLGSGLVLEQKTPCSILCKNTITPGKSAS